MNLLLIKRIDYNRLHKVKKICGFAKVPKAQSAINARHCGLCLFIPYPCGMLRELK